MQQSLASTSGRCCTPSIIHRSSKPLHQLHTTSAFPLQQHARQASRRHGIHICNASNTSTNSFAQRAQEFAESAQQRVQSFVQEQKLDEKAAAASKAAKEKLASAYEETEQNVRRTYMKLEREHNLSERVDKTKSWIEETARDIDQEYSIRRRLKSLYADTQRMLPVWKRQLSEFSSTQVGKATLTFVFVALLFSGLLWQLLNLFWLLWWVSVPVSLYLASQSKKAAEQQAAAGASSSFTGGRWGASSSSNSSSSNRVGYNSSDGPVVDAEWVSLDDDGSSGSSSGRRWK